MSIAASAATQSLPRAEWTVFVIGTALVLLRIVDDELLQPPAGTSVVDHPAALLVPAATGLAVAALYRRLRPGLRALASLVLGALSLVGGSIALAAVRVEGLHGSTWSGLLLLPAAALLLALAATTPWRARAQARRGWRRWSNRVVGTVAVPLVLFFFVVPVGTALWTTHKFREPVGTFDVPHENVSFRTSDGLRLSGWYVPSRNRAAVVIVHGGGGDRDGARRHARVLARAGYGVLLYDARGRGESQGAPDAYGWTWGPDVAAAVDFLAHRADVDRARIGALGLSTGADVLVQYAAAHHDVRAIVADGSTARSFDDTRRIVKGADVLTLPYWWVQYAAARVLSGGAPGAPLAHLSAKVAPAHIVFIASNWSVERTAAPLYAAAARQHHDLWEVDADHTQGLQRHPAEYVARLRQFFGRWLLDRHTADRLR